MDVIRSLFRIAFPLSVSLFCVHHICAVFKLYSNSYLYLKFVAQQGRFNLLQLLYS